LTHYAVPLSTERGGRLANIANSVNPTSNGGQVTCSFVAPGFVIWITPP
jgi:hypothetical protein